MNEEDKQKYRYNDVLSHTIRIHPMITLLLAFCGGPIGLFCWFYLNNRAWEYRQGDAQFEKDMVNEQQKQASEEAFQAIHETLSELRQGLEDLDKTKRE